MSAVASYSKIALSQHQNFTELDYGLNSVEDKSDEVVE